jgi:hypothetical protein
MYDRFGIIKLSPRSEGRSKAFCVLCKTACAGANILTPPNHQSEGVLGILARHHGETLFVAHVIHAFHHLLTAKNAPVFFTKTAKIVKKPRRYRHKTRASPEPHPKSIHNSPQTPKKYPQNPQPPEENPIPNHKSRNHRQIATFHGQIRRFPLGPEKLFVRKPNR